ncbi:hypothetical protein Tco_0869510 [Tanacetum coccineum]
MIRMIQGIDREDLEALWRIVKGKYGDIRPEDEFERVLEIHDLNFRGSFDFIRLYDEVRARTFLVALDLGSTRFCRKVEDGVEGCNVRFLMVLFSKDTSGSWKSVAATKDIG